LSRDYGWTPNEILGLTASEALSYLEACRNRPTSVFVSPRLAAEITAAARARRAARIDDALKFGLPAKTTGEEPGVWERLVAATLCERRAAASDLVAEDESRRDRAGHTDSGAMQNRAGLQKIFEELRALRQSLGGSGSRALWVE